MDSVSRKEIIGRIEYIMSHLLSKQYDMDIKIYLKKDEITNGNNNQTRDLSEE